MPVLIVGNTEIPYDIRRSRRVRQRRIVVTPGKVEAVVPFAATDDEVAAFMQSRRRWVYQQRELVSAAAAPAVAGPGRFATGSKIPFRGRQMRLTVTTADVPVVRVEYRSGFHVTVPANLDGTRRDRAIRSALIGWLKDRLLRDIRAFVTHYGRRLDLHPAGIKLREQKNTWAVCGKDRVLYVNWKLVFAPKPVLEYAVVHELCHLRHRNHSAEFWQLVGSAIRNHGVHAEWLERNGAALSAVDLLPQP